MATAEHNGIILILMGVSGSGKTTIGRRLARELDWDFVEGDDFHPEANVEKMRSGIPLSDDDRWPWLRALRDEIHDRLRSGIPTVVACSALKAAYREVLLDGNDGAHVVFLKGSYELIQKRMEERTDHFFDADLLDSQFEALEDPGTDAALTVSVDAAPEAIVRTICREIPALRAASE